MIFLCRGNEIWPPEQRNWITYARVPPCLSTTWLGAEKRRRRLEGGVVDTHPSERRLKFSPAWRRGRPDNL